jgi:uncharacterized protein YciI
LSHSIYRTGFLITAILLWGPVSAQTAQTAQTKPAEFELQKFYLVMLNEGPKWTTKETPELQKLHAAHIAHILDLGKSGKEVLAGPIGGDSKLRGVAVLSVATIEEARQLEDDDPAVKAGHLVADIHPWYAAKNIMKMPGGPLKLSTYYLGFLRKGAGWTPGETPELKKLMEAHLANIVRLHDMGKLVIAGPMGGDSDLRGIFIFKTGSIEEARSLGATDPAVQAGRLELELHPWMVPTGALP